LDPGEPNDSDLPRRLLLRCQDKEPTFGWGPRFKLSEEKESKDVDSGYIDYKWPAQKHFKKGHFGHEKQERASGKCDCTSEISGLH
jgi:hypothetical protein